MMLALLATLALLAPAPQHSGGLLDFAQTPRGPGNLLERSEVVGHSALGRPIELRQFGDPRWPGELLVLGCIHGEGCGAGAVEPLTNGCPDPSADIFLVPGTRLAARIGRTLEPAATIWLHQYRDRRPFVRAWGQESVPGARHFAALARMPFRLMRWPAGTGPNWQNHRFKAPAFVVELPQGQLVPAMRSRLSKALVRMGRWVRED
jgi:hypothetical protein